MYETSRNGTRWYPTTELELQHAMDHAGYDTEKALRCLRAGMELGGPITTLGVYVRYRPDHLSQA